MATPLRTEIDVLVVGAGPVGLTVAAELYRRGISCRIIDQKTEPATSSRALGTHARTLELYYNMGILDQIKALGQPVNQFTVYGNRRKLVHFDLTYKRFQTIVEYSLFVPQAQTEEVLRRHLANLGGQIEWGVGLKTLEQDGQGVDAWLTDQTGREELVRANWLVGCDGGHSLVRKLLGLPFEGSEDETWLVVDAQVEWDLPANSIQMFRTPQGTVVAFPFPQPGKYRLLETEDTHVTDPVLLAAQFQNKLRATLGIEQIVVHPPTWVSVFTIQQRAVPQMRQGRCFVAGDAAHCHSPASGQGLNTGIQDGFNLAWKLALVAQGVAQPTLLDSYSAEREPVAHKLLASAQLSTRLLQPRNPLLKRVGSQLAATLGRIEPLRRRVSARTSAGLSALPVHYRQSSLSRDEEAPVSRPWWQIWHRESGLRAGDRLPALRWDNSGQTLFDLLRHSQHTLFLLAGSSLTGWATAEKTAMLIEERYGGLIKPILVTTTNTPTATSTQRVVIEDRHGQLHKALGLEEGGICLVRPDGYIGYRSQELAVSKLENYLGRVFVNPTRVPLFQAPTV